LELLEKEKQILNLQNEKAISMSDISVLEAKTLSLDISLKSEKTKTLSLEKSLLAEKAKVISLEKSLLAETAKFSDSVKTESNNLRCKIHEKCLEISSLKKSLEALKSEVAGHKLVSEVQGSENSKLKFQTKSLQNTIKSLQNTNKKITHKWKEAEDNFSMAESKVLSLKESSNPTRPAIPKISAQQTNLPPKKAQVKVLKKKRNKKKTSPKTEYNYGFFHALASEKSSTPSDTAEDPGTDDSASVTASCVSLHGTPTGDKASEEARSEVVERIPPRKEVPASSSNSSGAFLAMAAPEDPQATWTEIQLKFQEMMDEINPDWKKCPKQQK
jgi:hypothetical protein